MGKRTVLVLCWMPLLTIASLDRAHAQSGSTPSGSNETAIKLEQTVRLETEALIEGANRWSRTQRGSVRAALETSLLETALRREEAMSALMEAAPDLALHNALPTGRREAMPPVLRDHIEQSVAETGTLEVLCILREDHTSTIERYLVVSEKRLRLLVNDVSEEYLTGTVMTVRGILLSDRLATVQDDITVIQAAAPEEVQGNGFQIRYALVININFPSIPTQPWTQTSAQNLFSNTIDPWYQEGSYGQMTIAGYVTEWFTISASTTTCATGTWQTQAVAAARAAGYEPNDWNHVVIAFPRVAACSWAGLAQVGGRYSWLNNAMNHRVAVHELGHNLGLSHSRSRRCSEGPLSGTCTDTEYGDLFDVMGSSLGHYHAAYRAGLNWIPSDDVIILTPEVGEAFVMLENAAASSGPRVVRVQRRGRNDYLHVEARAAVGYDQVLAQYPALQTGVNVYLGTGLRSQWIIDVGYTTTTRADAPLQFEEILFDSVGDVAIIPYYFEGIIYIYVVYGISGLP